MSMSKNHTIKSKSGKSSSETPTTGAPAGAAATTSAATGGFRAVATPETKATAGPVMPVERSARLDPRAASKDLPSEVGGYDGPEPTRFGDWEHKGRCTDF
jgi:hypothetical protein